MPTRNPTRVDLRPGPWFVAGGPGSGKTTLCTRLAEASGWPVLPSRDIVTKVDPGALTNGRMGAAGPVKEGLIEAVSTFRKSYGDSFIVDGCPRSPDQAEVVYGGMVILLRCRPSIAYDRLVNRGRLDDTPLLAARRVEEQYAPDDTWLADMATWNRCLNTSSRTAQHVFQTVWDYLTFVRKEVF